jgi:hypothetical protein
MQVCGRDAGPRARIGPRLKSAIPDTTTHMIGAALLLL